ncbi:MAG: phosphatidylserine decarboxylase [Candidatus Pelagibacterales bacterium]|nr:phosphatidylserine decarboxylase family protein [Candidatus Pelagibacter sp.]RPG06286.1 MAG: phosphatidylserine decarboxylase [Pelagibacteraceae bacterium TMED233]RZO63410.1 MAG: phosphatidylserine decarboxylase [Pelagibacterales bacterium]|tara:strand:- start:1876 stop:2523 length:648 start_codon:yes stop_codon:yes gene_type:complete
MINTIFPKIHSEGYKFIVISIFITLFLLFFSKFLAFITFVLTIWVYYFFRDPERISIDNENYLVSPADGLITQISEVDGPKELNLENKKFKRVSIFMNVFNCHVNRIPCDGKISEIVYKPGKFLNASLDKASEHNERNYIKVINNKGEEIIIVQIAGLVARRIVCECHENQDIKQGERVGMIRFGSRVDIYYENFNTLVKEKQNTTAGETLIAKI